jgi:hypothetical protein
MTTGGYIQQHQGVHGRQFHQCLIAFHLSNLVLFEDPFKCTISRVKPLKQSKFRTPPPLLHKSGRSTGRTVLGDMHGRIRRQSENFISRYVYYASWWKLTNITNNLRQKISQPRFETSIFQTGNMSANHGSVKLLNWSWTLLEYLRALIWLRRLQAFGVIGGRQQTWMDENLKRSCGDLLVFQTIIWTLWFPCSLLRAFCRGHGTFKSSVS